MRNERIIIIVFSVIGLLMGPRLSPAIDLGDAPIRNYPVSLTIQKKRLELSMDYMFINDTVDLFDVRDDAPAGEDDFFWSGAPSDMEGVRAFLNYGLFEKTMVRSAFNYRKFDYGPRTVTVKSLDACVKRNINDNEHGWAPFMALDFGIKTNFTDDMEPYRDVADRNLFGRVTFGKIYGDILPNYYLEYGVTSISSRTHESPGAVPLMDLGRDETYLKTGISLLWRFPYTAMAHIEYSYLRLFRDDGLDDVADNHILCMDINYFLSDHLILNLGSEFYLRQYNGIVPLLYSAHSREHMDHPHGRVHFGVTYLFEGE